jgi:DNA-binding transcriptional MerR regulator
MLRIGDFSRLARVTIKTLHHYDEAGLLRPAHVDLQTGYRYYTADQLEDLQRILLLKDLGFSLEQIRLALRDEDNHAGLAALLREHRERLARTIAEDQLRLRRLEALSEDATDRSISATTAVVLREIPATHVYASRERVPSMHRHVTAMFEAAEAAVAKHGARADASPFLLFHDSEWRDHDIDVEVCIPLSSTTSALTAREVESAPRAACVTYVGNYDQTQFIYDAMLRWLDRSGLQICGPLREVYHRYGADQADYELPSRVLATSSTEYVTELQVPVVVKL